MQTLQLSIQRHGASGPPPLRRRFENAVKVDYQGSEDQYHPSSPPLSSTKLSSLAGFNSGGCGTLEPAHLLLRNGGNRRLRLGQGVLAEQPNMNWCSRRPVAGGLRERRARSARTAHACAPGFHLNLKLTYFSNLNSRLVHGVAQGGDHKSGSAHGDRALNLKSTRSISWPPCHTPSRATVQSHNP